MEISGKCVSDLYQITLTYTYFCIHVFPFLNESVDIVRFDTTHGAGIGIALRT